MELRPGPLLLLAYLVGNDSYRYCTVGTVQSGSVLFEGVDGGRKTVIQMFL